MYIFLLRHTVIHHSKILVKQFSLYVHVSQKMYLGFDHPHLILHAAFFFNQVARKYRSVNSVVTVVGIVIFCLSIQQLEAIYSPVSSIFYVKTCLLSIHCIHFLFVKICRVWKWSFYNYNPFYLCLSRGTLKGSLGWQGTNEDQAMAE